MKCFLIGAALIAGQLSPVDATSGGKKRQDVRVTIADLDLNTPEGVAALDRRLARAVLKACGAAYYLDPKELEDVDRCRADARERAVAARNTILGGSKDHQ